MISEVQHKRHDHKGVFYLEDDGERIAEMTYSMAGEDKIIIDHTEVGQSYGGQGLGERLVEASVAYARQHQIKILPLCPFAKAQIQRHKEWQDVLP